MSNALLQQVSVLMSIYAKESPEFFSEALESVVCQSIPPQEIVLVQDGPIPEKLDDVIREWSRKIPYLNVIRLAKNSGLGEALRCGLLACHGEIIARMDTDDISHPDRFEKQLTFLRENPGIDVVGSWVREFEAGGSTTPIVRDCPDDYNLIVKMAEIRNPMNHVTVMFRKSAVLRAGNYQRSLAMEDYHLWVRMLLQGARLHNIQECLVSVRVGSGMYARRASWKEIKTEFLLQRFFLTRGFIGRYAFVRNLLCRLGIRLIPTNMRRLIYRRYLRQCSA